MFDCLPVLFIQHVNKYKILFTFTLDVRCRYDGMFAQRVESVQHRREDHEYIALFRGNQPKSFVVFRSQV